MFLKDMKYSLLLDFYGEMLGERRREIMEMYYNEDFSLSEIAEQAGISRQGVRDSVKKGESELSHLEEKLRLVERFEKIRNQIAGISEELVGIAQDADGGMRTSLLRISDSLGKLDI